MRVGTLGYLRSVGSVRYPIFLRFVLLACAAFTILCVFAGNVQAKKIRENQGIVVKHRMPPTYPHWAYTHGIGQGYAEVAFYVDEKGETSDFLVTEFSHKPFADELLKSVRNWKFKPARRQGVPIKSVCRAYWTFLPDRPVLTNALTNTSKHMDGREDLDFREMKYRREDELDKKPEMLRFAEVDVPEGYRLKDPKGESITVRIEFFVDDKGRVRLPTVVGSSDPELNNEVMSAFEGALFKSPVFDGEASLAWLEKTYMIPVSGE